MSSLVFPLSALGAVVKSQEPFVDVRIDESVSGKEVGSSWWGTPRYRYKIGFDVVRSDTRFDYQQLASYFARHFGPLANFLLVDPEDNAVVDMGFALGDGATTTFQLQRSLLGSVYDNLGGGPWPVSGKPRTNLCLWSEQADNAAWTKSAASILANVTLAPDGTPTADKLSENAANSQHFESSASITVLPGAVYTLSRFYRAAERTQVSLQATNGAIPQANFDLAAGTLLSASGGGSGAIAVVPGALGWYRCSITFTAAAGQTSSGIITLLSLNGGSGGAYLGDGGSGAYVWGGQAEAAAAPTQYIQTTSAAVTVNPAYWPSYSDGFEPVYDLNGPATLFQDGDWQMRRRLYQTPRTNMLPFSEAFDNAAWLKTNATITPDAIAAPDGTTTADQLNEGTATNFHFVSQNTSPAEVQGDLRCYSAFVKANTLPNIVLTTNTTDIGVNFNLSTGVVFGARGAALATGVIVYPGGWYRIWFISRVGASLGTGVYLGGADGSYGLSYTGTSRTFYGWGTMSEKVLDLSGPTSYIKTPSSSAVTVTDYTLGATGIVTPSPVLPTGAFLSWSGSYYRRVRFLNPKLSFDRIVKQMWSSQLELVSIK